MERNRAIGRQQAGKSCSAIGRVFHMSSSIITSMMIRYQREGTTRDVSRSGMTACDQDRYVRLRHPRNSAMTVPSTASDIQGLRRISSQIVWNCLAKQKYVLVGQLMALFWQLNDNVIGVRHTSYGLNLNEDVFGWMGRFGLCFVVHMKECTCTGAMGEVLVFLSLTD